MKPNRDQQSLLLASLLTSPGPIPPLFIYGAKGTGKTSLVLSILNSPSAYAHHDPTKSLSNSLIPHVYINCIEVYSERIFFEIVLFRLLSLRRNEVTDERGGEVENILETHQKTIEQSTTKIQMDEEEGSENRRKRFKGGFPTSLELASSSSASSTFNMVPLATFPVTCSRADKFLAFLPPLSSRQSTTFLVFDKAEKLRDLDLIPLVLSIPTLTNDRFGVVLISNRIWDHFRCQVGVDPICIFISPLSLDDIVEDLMKHCPKEEEEKFFKDFCTNVLRIFYFGTCDVQLLQSLIFSLYDIFVAPIREGKAERGETGKLYKYLEPHLKNALQKLNSKDIQTVDHQGPRKSSS